MNIRTATLQDIDQIAAVEKECFPAAEAATKEEFEQRLSHYADHFWLMFEDDTLIAFVDGMVTDQADLTDEMYENASMHHEDGAWQMIFGVNTLPAYRNHGYAGELLKRAIADAKDQGRKGLVLTCKDRLVHYYAKFGFENEGVSESVHISGKTAGADQYVLGKENKNKKTYHFLWQSSGSRVPLLCSAESKSARTDRLGEKSV